jgi:hypothetical protein
MPECPVCDSDNVRVSFRTPVWEFFCRWQGLQRYRCRECRKTFYQPLRPGETFAIKPRRRRRSEGRSKLDINLNSRQRKLLDGALFVLMVVVFYAALKAIKF